MRIMKSSSEKKHEGKCLESHPPFVYPVSDNKSHLERAGATSNTVCYAIQRCKEFRPCKRLECNRCLGRRRDYFLEMGTYFAKQRGLNHHVTVSWLLQKHQNPWLRCMSLSKAMSKALTGRIGPFIRVVSLGEKNSTPHVHYLVRSEMAEVVHGRAVLASPEEQMVWKDKNIAYDVPGLLGYFYDQNFVPVATDPKRVKGVRHISGSRGMSYGYPKTKHWNELKLLRNQQVNEF